MDRLTPAQYSLMVEALKLRRVDQDFEAHRQAFLNYAVKAQKKSGKKTVPVFRNFKKFFDYEKELEKVTGKKRKGDSRFAGISRLLKKGEDADGKFL